MKTFSASLFLALLAAVGANAGSINFCSDAGCSGSCNSQQPAGDGSCIQLGGISSAQVTEVDPGCSCKTIESLYLFCGIAIAVFEKSGN